jgi:hypothetical protein
MIFRTYDFRFQFQICMLSIYVAHRSHKPIVLIALILSGQQLLKRRRTIAFICLSKTTSNRKVLFKLFILIVFGLYQ